MSIVAKTDEKLGVFYVSLFLIVLWPFANFLNTNMWEFFSSFRLAAYFAAAESLALCSLAIAVKIFGRWWPPMRIAGLVCVGWLAVFLYPITFELADSLFGGFYLKTWAFVFLLLLTAAVFMSRALRFCHLLLVVSLSLAIQPMFGVFAHLFDITKHVVEFEGSEGDFHPASSDGPTNTSVYQIILDEYARSDVLKNVFGFDNSGFHAALESRGLTVLESATSNYPKTDMSIPSQMAMTYPFIGGEAAHNWQTSVQHLKGNGSVFDWFRANGYSSALLRFSGAYCRDQWPTYCLPSGLSLLGPLELNLVKLTPLFSLVDQLIQRFPEIGRHLYEFEDIREAITALPNEGPWFVHAHLLAPHAPYRFDAGCNEISIADQRTRVGEQAYIEQLVCTNSATLEIVDVILHKDPEAIIIVHADHGFRTGVAFEGNEFPVGRAQDYKVFAAVRLPEARECTRPPDDMTLVNSFRYIINCLGGEHVEILPNRHFLPLDGDERILEVTGKFQP